MTQSEIKAAITETPWSSKGPSVENEDWFLFNVENPSFRETMDDANAAAIVSAVNNTYGLNISPDAVPLIYKMLEGLAYEMKLHLHERNAIQSLLTAAKL